MFKFDTGLLSKKILIISDVDEDTTHIEMNQIEKDYIQTKMNQMKEYGAVVDYCEILTADELRDLLKKIQQS